MDLWLLDITIDSLDLLHKEYLVNQEDVSPNLLRLLLKLNEFRTLETEETSYQGVLGMDSEGGEEENKQASSRQSSWVQTERGNLEPTKDQKVLDVVLKSITASDPREGFPEDVSINRGFHREALVDPGLVGMFPHLLTEYLSLSQKLKPPARKSGAWTSSDEHWSDRILHSLGKELAPAVDTEENGKSTKEAQGKLQFRLHFTHSKDNQLDGISAFAKLKIFGKLIQKSREAKATVAERKRNFMAFRAKKHKIPFTSLQWEQELMERIGFPPDMTVEEYHHLVEFAKTQKRREYREGAALRGRTSRTCSVQSENTISPQGPALSLKTDHPVASRLLKVQEELMNYKTVEGSFRKVDDGVTRRLTSALDAVHTATVKSPVEHNVTQNGTDGLPSSRLQTSRVDHSTTRDQRRSSYSRIYGSSSSTDPRSIQESAEIMDYTGDPLHHWHYQDRLAVLRLGRSEAEAVKTSGIRSPFQQQNRSLHVDTGKKIGQGHERLHLPQSTVVGRLSNAVRESRQQEINSASEAEQGFSSRASEAGGSEKISLNYQTYSQYETQQIIPQTERLALLST